MTSQPYIRDIEENDAQSVAILIEGAREAMRSHYSEAFLDENLPADTAEDIKQLMKRRHIFVAIENGRVIGTASLRGMSVGMVFVDKVFHRRGIGKILVEYIERYALTLGFRSLKVLSSLNASGFYESLDFHGVRPVISHAAFPALLMEKRIAKEGLDLLSAYPALQPELEADPALLKGVNPVSFDRLTEGKYEILVSRNEKKEIVALMAGYNIYDFSAGLSGFEISALNIQPAYDKENHLARIAKEMALRVYCDGGRIISFKNDGVRKKISYLLKRSLNGHEAEGAFVMAENEITKFTN